MFKREGTPEKGIMTAYEVTQQSHSGMAARMEYSPDADWCRVSNSRPTPSHLISALAQTQTPDATIQAIRAI